MEATADDMVRVVRVLDGFNRLRFANDPEQLAAWVSATSLHEASRRVSESGDLPAPGGEVKPPA